MPVVKNTRKAAIAAGILVVIALGAAVTWFGYWHVIGSRNPYEGHNSYGMRDYTLPVQEKAAKAIVAGLNTGNPDNVELLRFHGRPEYAVANKAIAENITAVLPALRCQYTLTGVEDKGEQENPAALVPWYGDASQHARAFDMKLQQLCPGRQPTTRVVRVIAIPSGMGATGPKRP